MLVGRPWVAALSLVILSAESMAFVGFTSSCSASLQRATSRVAIGLAKVNKGGTKSRKRPRSSYGGDADRQEGDSGRGVRQAGTTAVENGVPSLVVMDLDYTLWKPELYQMDGAPYAKDKDGKVRDRRGTVIDLFPGVREALLEVHRGESFRGTRLAIASRASQESWARQVMDLIELEPGMKMRSVFSFSEIYSGSKVHHFGAIRKKSGVPYEEMIFFDDWDQNCIDVGRLGVTCVECPRGLNQQVWRRGLRAFATAQEKRRP